MGTRPKTGELLLLDDQNWVCSDCQICSTSGGIGQIGTAAIFGRPRQISSGVAAAAGGGVLGLAVSGGSAH